ncbi:excinuclease ABC subunit UvrB [Candidatus Peregrinibacteria bacterium]|nr:MAG: excinuclease ABC subunit UvrB [Candidatus Peregrinibacteria bacterium]
MSNSVRFELISEFQPAGDQPRAIAEMTNRILSGARHQTLLGATGTGKTFTMANIVANVQKPTLVIAHNKTLAAQLCSEFQEFFPNNAVSYFVSYYDYYQPEAYLPKTDTYIEKEATINEEINRFRHAATFNLLTRKDVLIVASVSCIYGLGDVESYEALAIKVKRGEIMKRDKFLRKLADIQYSRVHMDFKPGMFHVLGDVVEILPPSSENAFRIEFFGDEVETLSEIDSFTGEVLNDLEEVVLFPAKHNVSTEEKVQKAIAGISRDLDIREKEMRDAGKTLEAHRLRTRTEYDLELLREVGYVNGIENYTRYLSDRAEGDPPATLLEYFPDDFLVIVDESHMTIPQIGAMHEGNLSRKKMLVEHGFRLPSAMDNRPLKFSEFESLAPQMICVSATPGKYEFEKCASMQKDAYYQHIAEAIRNETIPEIPKNFSEQIIRPTGLLDPTIEIRSTKHQVDDILEEIRIRKKKGERALVTTLTKKSAENLTNYLRDAGVSVKYLHSDVETLERIEIIRELREGSIDVIVGINLLREGLDIPEVSLVAILDADKEGFLRSRDALIQTMGRAARNSEGKAILFADRETEAMKQAIAETTRRRLAQEAFNKKHGITPQTIKKKIKDIAPSLGNTIEGHNTKKIRKDRVKDFIRELEAKMEIAVQNLEFEKAADLRDEIEMLKDQALK